MDRRNILFAGDDVDDYKFFLEAFEKISNSFSITRVINGLECITHLKTHEKPQLIFFDLNFPIKSGIERLRFIKQSEGFEDVPVIIQSTSHYIKHIDSAFKGSAHYYIVKPSNAYVLVEILHVVMNRLDESLELPCKEQFVVRNIVTLEQ